MFVELFTISLFIFIGGLMSTMKQRERVIVFDVNETLLDIEILNPFFARIFGDPGAMRQWFAEVILYSQALTVSGGYAEFGEIAVAVLEMVAQIKGVSLQTADIETFKACMRELPAHQDCAPALEMLRGAGFRLVTLTNSAPAPGQSALERSGLAHYFEQQFSVHPVARFKPAAETYRSVASALGVQPGSLRLVAAHAWDTLGASASGWAAALVTRPGNAPFGIGKQPDIVEKDLLAVARQIIAKDS